MRFAVLAPGLPQETDSLLGIGHFRLGKLQRSECLENLFLDLLLPNCSGCAVIGVAPVVDVAFLHLTNERVPAMSAAEQALKEEVVMLNANVHLAVQDTLDPFKQ